MTTYTITELPPPSGSSLLYSEAYALNVNASAAGCALVPTYEAVLWDGGGAALLENLQPDSIAYGINDAGDVVGVFDLEAIYPVRSFLYTNGQFQLLTSVLGDEDCWAADINNDGVVVGSIGGLDAKRPFVYDSKGGGSVTLLDPLPGHAMAWAYAVSDTGHVAGISANAQWEDERVFLFRNGQVQDLGIAPWVTGINSGDVLTGARTFPGARRIPRIGLMRPQAAQPSKTSATPRRGVTLEAMAKASTTMGWSSVIRSCPPPRTNRFGHSSTSHPRVLTPDGMTLKSSSWGVRDGRSSRRQRSTTTAKSSAGERIRGPSEGISSLPNLRSAFRRSSGTTRQCS